MSKPTLVRPSVDIPALQQRCADLERRVSDLEAQLEALPEWLTRLQETVDQLMGVIECGKVPAPVFLRWDFTKHDEDSRQEARARFGHYLLEVIDYPPGVYWEIKRGSQTVAIGGHPCSFSAALDEAEEALRRIIQEKQIRGGGEGDAGDQGLRHPARR